MCEDSCSLVSLVSEIKIIFRFFQIQQITKLTEMKNMNPDNYNLSILIFMVILLKTRISVKRDYFDSFELDKFRKGIYILKIESNYYSKFKKIILE